jgi:beta-lactamase regulating signal transducer with metallopeptidase domain
MNPQILLDFTHSWLWRASWQVSVVIVLVLLVQWTLRGQLTPRWRHALWLLVLVRLALPWTVASPWSLFNWVEGRLPVMSSKATDEVLVRSASSSDPEAVLDPDAHEEPKAEVPAASGPIANSLPWKAVLALVWMTGVVALPSYLLWSTWRLGRRIRRQRPLTDQSVLNLLEDCKQEMGVLTPLSLVETTAVSSPSLFGFLRPRLLLPAGLTQSFSLPELRYVFLHELGHVRRGDIILNWLMTVPLILHWFNPLVWYAWSRMRLDRELACDALALSRTREGENRPYGQTIIKLLEGFSRPAVAPGLVGILENQNQMKRRISMIAKFKKTNRWPLFALSVCAALAVVTLTDAQPGQAADDTPKSAAPAGGPPRIVSTSPKVGATDVDPDLAEISVTFDRDMAGGFSWTGGGSDYPASPEGTKAKWRNARTCVLPVNLQSGRYYRVGINSTSFQNFRSVEGVAAQPSAIYFTTKGASEQLKRKVTKPQIVAMEPENGAADVDPSLTELRITFNVAMGGGFSWTGGGPEFPTIPEGKKPTWSQDHKTCTLPVALQPGSSYRLGLNSPSHKNFQSTGGVPLDPVSYTFKTK